MTGRVGVIRQKVVVKAPPEAVYEAYVDLEKHTAFTGSPARGTSRVGGSFTAWDGYISGRFTALEPGKKVVHEWVTTEWPEGCGPSRVELTFKRLSSGRTELAMTHSGVPAEQMADYAQGWEESYWEPLREYFSLGDPRGEGRKPGPGGPRASSESTSSARRAGKAQKASRRARGSSRPVPR